MPRPPKPWPTADVAPPGTRARRAAPLKPGKLDINGRGTRPARRQPGVPFAKGMTVFDVDGARIGEVDAVFPEPPENELASMTVGGEARFGRGFLQVGAREVGLGRTLYVPFSEVVDIRDGGIYLDVHKEAVENRDWDLRPVVLDEWGFGATR